MRAYELGAGTQMEKALLEEGAIRRDGDGHYRLFSREAVNGTGEAAAPGDFFKVDEIDGRHYPYTNGRAYFLANHRRVGEDVYEQARKPLTIWQAGDGIHEAMAFLLDTHQLQIDPGDDRRWFHAWRWNAPLTAPRDAVLVFYSIDRDGAGAICQIDFGFVAGEIFARDYEYCDERGVVIQDPGSAVIL